jgi:formylglycine-generating enzyme required for sulfatase activity/DNA-binding winged helix-turn-helix (wHTH) protein
MEQMGMLRFDRFELDLDRGSLRGPDGGINLRPKAFEVLRILAGNAGRLVSKQELMETVWPNVFVSGDSLVQCVRELRDKLGDSEHRLIKTVSRRGYLLDATTIVQTDDTEPDGPAIPADAPPAMSPRPGRFARGRLLWGTGLLCVALVCIALAPYLAKRSTAPAGLTQLSSDLAPGHSFKDCETCPEMVALPAGKFLMGSPDGERGHLPVEGPPRHVAIAKPIAIGKYEVTVDQFSAFIADAGVPVNNQCRLTDPATFTNSAMIWGPPTASFREPGYDVTGLHPVGCISWHEAEAYVAWLKRRTGKPYRLPTETEWEYAARAGTTTSFSFGDDTSQLCEYARFADLASPFTWRDDCRGASGVNGPLQVGTLKPNPWGLYDMHGNLWEWVEDCWTSDPLEIPTDGSALMRPGHCETGVVRGGSWAAAAARVRSAFRLGLVASRRDHNLGFRVALPLGE